MRQEHRQSTDADSTIEGGPMRVVSVNVGLPREVVWRGQVVSTGIYKDPVTGPVRLERENLAGDRQADLTVHGGPDKAVYVYPAAYYEQWRQELQGTALPWGIFGENLTLAGVSDATVCIGDRYRIGSAEVVVTQPRLPCYKLGIRFGHGGFVRRFLAASRPGFYFAVAQTGEITADGSVTLLSREAHGVTVADVFRLAVRDRSDVEGLRRAISVTSLPIEWREDFAWRLERLKLSPK